MANILIIDDDDDLRLTIARMLEMNGHEVIQAPNGARASGLCKANLIDLIITDIFMPEQDGLGTIFALKRAYPHLKFIAMSGGGTGGKTHYLEHAKAFGADLTFHKPVDTEELLEAIDQLIALQSSELNPKP